MGMDSFAYKLVFLLHLIAVIVGFGSTFVYPVLAAKSRKLEPKEAYAINHTVLGISDYLSAYPIYSAIVLGLGLVVLGSESFKFSQMWVTLACLLVIFALAILNRLHLPNLRAMDALQEKLVSGKVKPGPDGKPKEVAELEERGAKAGMYGGVLHVLFLLLMIDMVWKPGLGVS